MKCGEIFNSFKVKIPVYSLNISRSNYTYLIRIKFALFFSRPQLDVYEYNSEETNVDKVFREIVTEEKRSHSRAGCDCQLSVSFLLRGTKKKKFQPHVKAIDDQRRRHNFILFQTTLIDLGPTAFPRHIRNVTCDEHKRCYHSRNKGLHCLPIHYQVHSICVQTKDFNFEAHLIEYHKIRLV